MIGIIPAIDIMDGKCVRLSQGEYSSGTIYNHSPVDVALRFEDHGLRRLHIVDLDGAREGRIRNYKVLEKIAVKTSMIIDFGGGIKNEEDVRIVFESGAEMISVGSVAVREPVIFQSWIHRYGAGKIFLGADVRNEKIAVNGWKENTEIFIYDFLNKQIENGIKYVFCTDISKDGMLGGPATSLYRSILREFPDLHLVASGGVSSMQDIEDLEKAGCREVIVGKALYENKISLEDIRALLK